MKPARRRIAARQWGVSVLVGTALLLLLSSCGSDSAHTPGRYVVTFRDMVVNPNPLVPLELIVNVFDSETLQWQYPGGLGAAPAPPGASSYLGAIAATAGDGILAFGGSLQAPLQVLHYDRLGNTWTSRRPLPDTRFGMTATTLADGWVLIAGGATELGGLLGQSLGTAVIYNPATDQYVDVGALHQPRHGHYSAVLPDGRVLLAGGSYSELGFGQLLASAETWDPATREFTASGAMSGWRYQAAVATLADGRIFFVGDNPPESWPAFGYAEIYDPSAGVFVPTAPLLEDRHRPVAATLQDGRVLVAGGRNNTSASSRTAEIYDPVANLFTPAADMTVGRWGAAAALLPDGRVLVIGGNTSDAAPSGCELFDPQKNSWTALTELADDDCRTSTPPVSLPLP